MTEVRKHKSFRLIFEFAEELLRREEREVSPEAIVDKLTVESMKGVDYGIVQRLTGDLSLYRHLNQKERLRRAKAYVAQKERTDG